jgi:hypothetical protein
MMVSQIVPKPAHAVVMIHASPADIANALRALANQLDQEGVINQVLAQSITAGKQAGNFIVTDDGEAYASITIVFEP